MEVTMKSWRERFQAMATAVAFAEAGEWDTAASLVKEAPARSKDRSADRKKRPEQRVRPHSYRT
jgi:hypothetical protein